jgi:hypothetical protein
MFGPFAHVNEFGVTASHIKHRRIDESVEHHDVGPSQ